MKGLGHLGLVTEVLRANTKTDVKLVENDSLVFSVLIRI